MALLRLLAQISFSLHSFRHGVDAILSNTDLIPEPTDRCSKAGIRTFTPVVYDVVHYLTNQALSIPSKESTHSLRAKYGAMVQKVNKKPWSFS